MTCVHDACHEDRSKNGIIKATNVTTTYTTAVTVTGQYCYHADISATCALSQY